MPGILTYVVWTWLKISLIKTPMLNYLNFKLYDGPYPFFKNLYNFIQHCRNRYYDYLNYIKKFIKVCENHNYMYYSVQLEILKSLQLTNEFIVYGWRPTRSVGHKPN